jgi:O-antigen ligase
MWREARHATIEGVVPGQPVRPVLARPSRSWLGGLAALIALLPVWLPRPLMIGDVSLAFAIPFILALWALSQPAWPHSLRRALNGRGGRGLWLETNCIVAILILATLSMFVSEEPLRAFRVILPMSYAFCALVLLTRIPPHLQRRFLYALLLSGTVTLGVALLMAQTSSGRSLVMRDYRFLAFFENPNQLGIVLLAVWPPAVAILLSARSVPARLTALASVVVLASAIFMSGTKTALALGFAAGALVWLYHASRSGSLGKTMLNVLIVGGLLVLAVPAALWVLSWASPAFFKRVDDILTHGVWQFQSMKTRSVLWSESIRVGLDHPLLGHGAGTMVLDRAHSHNMVLDYFRAMGVFALVAVSALILGVAGRVVSFLVSTGRKGKVERGPDTIVAGLYIGALFDLIGNQLSDSFSPTTSFLFWMMYFGAYLTALHSAVAVRPAGQASTLAWAPRARTSPMVGTAAPQV